MLTKIKFAPGIDKQDTSVGAEGRWVDSDNVRFRYGLPEKVGGWSSLLTDTIVGVARKQHAFIDTDGNRYVAIGTDKFLLIYFEGQLFDITPLKADITGATIATVDGSPTCTITTSSAHNISVGDIVDYGPHAKSTIHLARTIAVTMDAMFIEGNHDNKIYRYLKGNDVVVSHGMVSTIKDLESDDTVKENFMFLYEQMKNYINIGDTYMTHAAFTSSFWDGDTDSKQAKRAYLYGEIDKNKPTVEYNGQDYPARTYDWADAVPSGKTVIVGHDRTPLTEVPAFHDEHNKVTIHDSKSGGKVVWIDTGAGKGGHVTGATLSENGEFLGTVEFK